MDESKLVKLLWKAEMAMRADEHLKHLPQVAIQHMRRHLSTKWRLLKDAEKL